MIRVYNPYLPAASLRHAQDALSSGWISSRGSYVERAGEQLASVLGVRHALLVNSGTAALHLISRALSSRAPALRDLAVPNLAYVAAYNAFLFDGRFALHPVDTDARTWNVDTAKLADQAPSAIVVVHNLGSIVDVPALKLAHPNAIIVEDCCEGLFGRHGDSYAGTKSLASAISFYGNKTLTTGEGGAVLTDDSELFEFMRCLSNQGQSETPYLHRDCGYNYRMTNVQAALLLGQLEIAAEILERKALVFQRYHSHLDGLANVEMQQSAPGTSHSHWMVGVRLRGSPGHAIAAPYFAQRGIEIRPMFRPIWAHDHLKSFAPTGATISDVLSRECLMLPSGPDLSAAEIKRVTDTVVSFLSEHCTQATASEVHL